LTRVNSESTPAVCQGYGEPLKRCVIAAELLIGTRGELESQFSPAHGTQQHRITPKCLLRQIKEATAHLWWCLDPLVTLGTRRWNAQKVVLSIFWRDEYPGVAIGSNAQRAAESAALMTPSKRSNKRSHPFWCVRPVGSTRDQFQRRESGSELFIGARGDLESNKLSHASHSGSCPSDSFGAFQQAIVSMVVMS
jgi:hypothetical protein